MGSGPRQSPFGKYSNYAFLPGQAHKDPTKEEHKTAYINLLTFLPPVISHFLTNRFLVLQGYFVQNPGVKKMMESKKAQWIERVKRPTERKKGRRERGLVGWASDVGSVGSADGRHGRQGRER